MKNCFFFIFLTSSLFAITQPEAELLFSNGNKAFGEKKFEEALHFYQTAVQFNRSAHVYFNLGQTYVALGKPGFALAYFLKAEKINPCWPLLTHTLEQFYKTYTSFPTYSHPWYHTLFKCFSSKNWYWVGSICFWIGCCCLIYTIGFKRSKKLLYTLSINFTCAAFVFLLILLNKKFDTLCILPENTEAHFAPSQQSPIRYTWPMGTQLWVKSKHQTYYFVQTLQGEDGWIIKDKLIELK